MIARRTSFGLDSLLSKVLEFLSFQRCHATRKTRESKACLSPFGTDLRERNHHDQKGVVCHEQHLVKAKDPQRQVPDLLTESAGSQNVVDLLNADAAKDVTWRML